MKTLLFFWKSMPMLFLTIRGLKIALRSVLCVRMVSVATLAAVSVVFHISLIPGSLLAQTYPQRPIQLIVPTSAGGGTDIVARIVGQKLTEGLGQNVIIDNRSGAGGNIGVGMAANSAPDGHTLLVASVGHIVMNPSLMRTPFDTLRDFSAVSVLASGPYILIVHPSVPVKSVKDLINLGRAGRGELNYGTGGTGTSSHFVTELFMESTKTKLTHVPYKGNGPATVGLVSGEIDLMFNTAPPSLPHIKSERIRAVAMTGLKRSKSLPEVPTVDESGVPGFEATVWYGMLARAGTPPAIIARLNMEIAKLTQLADVHNRLAAEGVEPVGSTSQHFSEYLRAEMAKWSAVVKRSKIRPDA